MSLITKVKDLFNPKPSAESAPTFPAIYYGEDYVSTVLNLSPAELYRTQPHLKTVIDFRARNVAQLGLKAYQRKEDNDRKSATGTALDLLLRDPNRNETLYELLVGLVSDYDLYGAAYWAVFPDVKSNSGWQIRPLPAAWITGTEGGTMWAPEHYLVSAPNGVQAKLPAGDLIVFKAWNPAGTSARSTSIDALKDVLAEQIEAWRFRRQVWTRGGRVGTYVTRPKDAPTWTEGAQDRFRKEWQKFQGSGAKAGSAPLLQDGMEIKRVGFSAREEEWAESAKLSLQTVASVYHVQPAMIGDTSGASYASTKEFRSMLYTETLGPLLRMIEKRLNQFLVPLIDPTGELYVEFNIDAKLSGNFEEQAAILSTATGAPWMTVNEARARRNLPRIEGADGLIVPLNVIAGGQASPQDGGKPSVAVENAKEQ